MLIGFLSNGQNQLRKIIFEITLYKLNFKTEVSVKVSQVQNGEGRN